MHVSAMGLNLVTDQGHLWTAILTPFERDVAGFLLKSSQECRSQSLYSLILGSESKGGVVHDAEAVRLSNRRGSYSLLSPHPATKIDVALRLLAM